MNNIKKILKDLSFILEKKDLKETDKTTKLKFFDSVIILQIMNLAKSTYDKQIDGAKVQKCKKISDIINLIAE
jgi:acyl carrier protein|tara:strand:- start:212 stop:430 length:219 start_codon:yes stop_codon:yes gene_type:complete